MLCEAAPFPPTWFRNDLARIQFNMSWFKVLLLPTGFVSNSKRPVPLASFQPH